MPFVSSSGARLYYEAHGAGPAIVFGHGLSAHTLFFYQQVPYFARSYRVIVFDHRGFGRSACRGKVSPEYFVEDLDQHPRRREHRTCRTRLSVHERAHGVAVCAALPRARDGVGSRVVTRRDSHRSIESGVRCVDPEASEARLRPFGAVVRMRLKVSGSSAYAV
jgi:alpha-beta hydrolase superfamily lysophospholipase